MIVSLFLFAGCATPSNSLPSATEAQIVTSNSVETAALLATEPVMASSGNSMTEQLVKPTQVEGYEKQRQKLIEHLRQTENVVKGGYPGIFAFGESYYEYPWLNSVLVWGEGTDIETLCLLYQIGDKNDRGGLAPWVLMMDTGDTVSFAYAGSGPRSSNFQLGDIDGDGLEEILTHIDSGGNEGAGHFYSTLYRWNRNELTTIYTGKVYEPWPKVSQIETSFEINFIEPFTYRITNKQTGFDEKFRAPGENYVFDAGGKALKGVEPYELACYEDFADFHLEDIDGDTINELLAAEYFSLSRPEACLMLSALRYEKTTNSFIQVKSDVWYSESSNKPWYEYAYNWYK